VHIALDVEIDFYACSSYGATTKPAVYKLNKGLFRHRGKNVIIVGFVFGITLNFLKGYLENRKPKSINLCLLASRRAESVIKLTSGFTVEDKFIIIWSGFQSEIQTVTFISF
jgi:hypoxanthine-guanine phosphoribosyltransferase